MTQKWCHHFSDEGDDTILLVGSMVEAKFTVAFLLKYQTVTSTSPLGHVGSDVDTSVYKVWVVLLLPASPSLPPTGCQEGPPPSSNQTATYPVLVGNLLVTVPISCPHSINSNQLTWGHHFLFCSSKWHGDSLGIFKYLWFSLYGSVSVLKLEIISQQSLPPLKSQTATEYTNKAFLLS